ncbi:MAG: hypothetical protein IKY23_08395 [Lachnospiraceae bacterium]|nr:hypothetical protein [Lachnospiraceae bacterium]
MEDIIKDELFGEVKYKPNIGSWVGITDAPLYNSEGNLKLVVQDLEKEGILDVQREAYKTYLQNADKYKESAVDYLLDYYKWNYEYIASEVSGVNEKDHKDVVTETQLFEFMTLWYLFICRDGSFGYAFGCCWDVDNGLAVLLSEEEPRIISRTQLENLHKINDDTIGLLVHYGKNTWKGWKKHSLFGKNEHLEIELEGSVEDGITEVQKKAYAEYLQKEDELFRKFTEVLEASGADRTALPKVLYIDKEGNYGWICFALWNDKYIGVLLSEDVPSILSEKRLRNYRRRTMSVKPEEFGFSNRFFGVLSCNVFVWGEETEICVDKEKGPLEDLVPLINKLISYLNHNEDIVFKAIVDDAGMLKKAEYYIDCMEEAEGSTEECRVFILEDGTVVTLPLAEEDFIESLHLKEVFIEFDNEEQDISAQLTFDCMPDYFPDPGVHHIIAVNMGSKGNIIWVEMVEI